MKTAGWGAFRLLLALARFGYRVSGRTREVDTVVYKVDRLGDWLLAEASIGRIVSSARSRNASVMVWAGRESDAIRRWRPPDFDVEAFALEPRGLWQKVARAFAVVGLLARFRPRTVICLRYSPEPVRDFVLANAGAREVFALSWRIAEGPLGPVPHEVARHQSILTSAGVGPVDARGLLPFLSGRQEGPFTRVVIAPYSSARTKDWSDEGWCQVASSLAPRGLQFEIWVGPDQSTRAQTLAGKMAGRIGSGRVSVESGSLGRLADAVSSAALVLTVDTFAAHLAAAFDSPMVGLVGGGQYGDFVPWQNSARQRWVTHRLPCFGCNWRCSRSRIECLEDITPSEVLIEAEAALDGKKR